MARALAGSEVAFDAPVPYLDGTFRQTRIRFLPRRIAGGTIDGFFVMVADTAEHQPARADLQEVVNRLRLWWRGWAPVSTTTIP